MLRIDNSDIRFHAYLAIKAIGDAGKAAAVPALTALARDKDGGISQAAAGVFSDVYPEESEKAGVPKVAPPDGSRGPA